LGVPWPKECGQAKNRDSRGKESLGVATQAHSENLVYRILPGVWQFAGGIAEPELPIVCRDYKIAIVNLCVIQRVK
jgi:hypothetical protein